MSCSAVDRRAPWRWSSRTAFLSCSAENPQRGIGLGGRPGSLRAPQVDLWQAVDAERLRQLAAVVGVVAEEAEQDRLSRVDLRPLADLALELLGEHVGGPSIEAAGDDLPGRLERLGQL